MNRLLNTEAWRELGIWGWCCQRWRGRRILRHTGILTSPTLPPPTHVGIARNHAFLDGNKRTAWVVAETFLLKNGYELIAGDEAGVTAMLAVADGSMPEPELAVWFRTYIRPLNAK